MGPERTSYKPDAANPAVLLELHIGRQGRRVAELERSAFMRAERAKLKSLRDEMIIAQGKRSSALGYGRKMIASFFLPVWRASGAPNRKEKRGWGGGLFTQGGSRLAPLPWAIITPPRRGSVKAKRALQATSGLAPLFFPAQRTGALLTIVVRQRRCSI
jgi:hypothetical protein